MLFIVECYKALLFSYNPIYFVCGEYKCSFPKLLPQSLVRICFLVYLTVILACLIIKGAYRDDNGKPVVLECVREAERRIAGNENM